MSQDSNISERDELEGDEGTPLLQPSTEENIGIAGLERGSSNAPTTTSSALPPLSRLSINTDNLDNSKDETPIQTPSESYAEKLLR